MLPAKQQIRKMSSGHIQTGKRSSEPSASYSDAYPEYKRSKVAKTQYSASNKNPKTDSGYQKGSTRPNVKELSLKRKAGLELYTKKKKVQNIAHPDNNTYNNFKEEALLRPLPNNHFFRSLKKTIIDKQDSQLSQNIIIEKLLAFPKLNIPYTLLSGPLVRYNKGSCDALLNKIVVKRNQVYQIDTQLQQILNNNIKPSALSSMLNGCRNNAPETFMQLVNTITENQILAKIKELKNIGFEMHNLSSMLNGCRNKAPETFMQLVNTITENQILAKIKELKNIGFEVHNLSSMLSGCRNKAPETFMQLINTITGNEMLAKLKKLKSIGFEMHNLSSMLNNCGNNAPETFVQLINAITGNEMLAKLKKLKSIGFEMHNLSSMLSGCGNKAPETFMQLINTITGNEMLAKLKKLKSIGFEIHNLSSMLNSCRNNALKAFVKLINTITGNEMLAKLKKLKSIGAEVSNLASMLDRCGNKATETFVQLINKITENQILDKIKELKNIGFEVHNLSSMLSGCRNKAPKIFMQLINTITGNKMLAKLKKLKSIGFEMHNLSSMLNGCGNKAPETFEKLISTLTGKGMLEQLGKLKEKGIPSSSLSAILRQSGIKACDRLTRVIDLLTNEKYIDTIEKVRAAMHTNPNLINENDAILVSRSASKRLEEIGDLKKIKFVRDPSNDKAFKQFLTHCYNKNKHVDERLMAVQKVSNDDPRQALHGQDKVVAKQKITKGTILGIYTGILLCEEEPIDLELAYLATKNIYGLNKLNSYSFGIIGSLYLSGCGRGNILMKINANKTYNDKDSTPQPANVSASLNSCDGKTPFVLFYATQDIPAHTELLLDYGKQYWENHDNNNELSNPDAKIYRELLNKNKYVAQAESIRFLRLIKEHDHSLYQDLLKNIEQPSRDFSWKDRWVACRNINDPHNKNIHYRIYKLPGDEAKGDKTQDYFSVSVNQVNKVF